ncbi:MAG: replication-associated recombination protein A [Desulfatitalea sp.]|nr:replication-associated recombination protein A [Desulfatitalea sp.]NNK00333.1 replication-associated recombination protein A [Desulfatitalea sp.]
MNLFDAKCDAAGTETRPLAERMRPQALEEFVGQQAVVGPGSLLAQAIRHDRLFSIILWGPPGSGKTTLARIVSRRTGAHFVHFSAVLAGIKEIRAVIEEARDRLSHHAKATILFVDEIHRFNKAQQDAFLHHVESGLLTLIGATTENPSFEVIPALLSRCRVLTLDALCEDDLKRLLQRAVEDPDRGLGRHRLQLEDAAGDHLVRTSGGDARTALNHLEMAAFLTLARQGPTTSGVLRRIGLNDVEQAIQQKALRYDKSGEEHYNIISAFHKSLRGSDPDAALYWLARMLMAGEDPLYVARRMIRFASEDVGNADPYALRMTLSAAEAYRQLGPPEGELALAQAAVYLATASKSNSIYAAYGRVQESVRKTGTPPVPLHIRNAPTPLMKTLGYGGGYKYAHDYTEAFTPQNYLPEALTGSQFYFPREHGYEKMIKQRLDHWRRIKAQKPDK